MSTSFDQRNFALGKLVEDIDAGEIGLPEIQRPFVWERSRVRDLFDSMYRGFPVGYFLFWANRTPGARAIGAKEKQSVPRLMIVDGQQRLTSLYAVIKGASVIDKDYKFSTIDIAFNPLQQKFAVTDAAIRRDPTWIPNISALWGRHEQLFSFANRFLDNLHSARIVNDDEKNEIFENINRLHSLTSYTFTALELSADLDPEEVADIFVRINSQGVELNQADFILTLMSVYWDNGRKALEAFARDAKQPRPAQPSPFNHFIDPAPDQLLRVAVGLGFRRGRLRAVYSLLRGRDPETEQSSEESRDRNFETLAFAQEEVLNLTNWHEFLKCLVRAGFRSRAMITSENSIIYSYLLFLIGRRDFGMPLLSLREVIARWVFMAQLSGRYTGSYESAIEADLARLRGLSAPESFCNLLDRIVTETLTDDFWTITLSNALETSAARSPSLFAYYAALNLLDARVLFSKLKVAELFDPAVRGDRSSLERHHLFPRAYLRSIGVGETRDTNQIANYALVEWPDNAAIGDASPGVYAPPLMRSLSPAERKQVMFWHALPEGWENMPYESFLANRRKLMALVIKAGFEKLKQAQAPEAPADEGQPRSLAEILATGEGPHVEFKSTARWNLQDDRVDERMEHGVLKTIAAFLNSAGGTLLIGVDDSRSVVGLTKDYRTLRKQDRDGFALWLFDLLERAIGKAAAANVSISFERLDGLDVARIDVKASSQLVFLNPAKGPRVDDVYIRLGPSTRKLTPSEVLSYQASRREEQLLSEEPVAA